MTTTIEEPVRVDVLTVGSTFNAPAGSIANTNVSSTAGDRISAEKTEAQYSVVWATATATTTVASVTKTIHAAEAAGTIVGLAVCPESVPDGDYQYTVDIQKAADASGSFSSILSSAEVVDSTSTDYTRQDVAINTTSYSADDRFQIVITASGTSGTQGAGLTVRLTLREEPLS